MQRHTLKSLSLLFGVAFPVLFVDQVTKWLIQNNIALRNPPVIVIIKDIFELSYTTNTGAAFGLMPGQNLPLIIVTIIAIGFIFIYFRQFQHSLWMTIALGFLLGGAVGKFYRSDFLWPSHRFPSVSIAAEFLVANVLTLLM